jgi:hypothetical protein
LEGTTVGLFYNLQKGVFAITCNNRVNGIKGEEGGKRGRRGSRGRG